MINIELILEDLRHAVPTIAVALIAWMSKRIAARFTSTFDRLDALEEQQIRMRAHIAAEAKVQNAAHDGFNRRLDGIENQITAIATSMRRQSHGDE